MWLDERIIKRAIHQKIPLIILDIDLVKKFKDTILYTCGLRNEGMKKFNRKLYENLSRFETAIKLEEYGYIEKELITINDNLIQLVTNQEKTNYNIYENDLGGLEEIVDLKEPNEESNK